MCPNAQPNRSGVLYLKEEQLFDEHLPPPGNPLSYGKETRSFYRTDLITKRRQSFALTSKKKFVMKFISSRVNAKNNM
ncbi:hypothetical protein JTE90_024114 [Oedothorax gibbosus]|uniref:Uncharacterized protein n=1 Tax=Oedothorax gibbosus TaxID=931172 RepID=A0AAV6UUD3_9ARAC|nr:hypothetical protein JTE90_024114 [Oedothorax gibbosus]